MSEKQEMCAAVAVMLLVPAAVTGVLVFGASHFIANRIEGPTAFESVETLDDATRALFGFPEALVPARSLIRVGAGGEPGLELLVQLTVAQATELKAALALTVREPLPPLDDVAQMVQRQCPVLRATSLTSLEGDERVSLREAREFECADVRWLYLSAWVLP